MEKAKYGGHNLLLSILGAVHGFGQKEKGAK